MTKYSFEILRQRLASFLESLPETVEHVSIFDSPRGAQFLKISVEMDYRIFWKWYPTTAARIDHIYRPTNI